MNPIPDPRERLDVLAARAHSRLGTTPPAEGDPILAALHTAVCDQHLYLVRLMQRFLVGLAPQHVINGLVLALEEAGVPVTASTSEVSHPGVGSRASFGKRHQPHYGALAPEDRQPR